MTKRQGISVLAFATAMGVRDNAVRSRIRNGKLAPAVFPDGSLDEAKARALWFSTADTSKMRERPGDKPNPARIFEEGAEGATENKLKIERLQIQIETDRINLEALRETMVDREEVRTAAREFGRLHRDAMLNFANRFGPAIAAEVGCDDGALIAAISAKMREALQESLTIPTPFHEPGELDEEPGDDA